MLQSGKNIIEMASGIRATEIKSMSRDYMDEDSEGSVEFTAREGGIRKVLHVTAGEQTLNIDEMYKAIMSVRTAVQRTAERRGVVLTSATLAPILAAVTDLETVVTFARTHYTEERTLKPLADSFARLHLYMAWAPMGTSVEWLMIPRPIDDTPVLNNLLLASRDMHFQLRGKTAHAESYLASIDRTYAALRDLAYPKLDN